MENSICFTNRACKAFPCHKGIPEDEFNCLFCFCPLYTLGEACGGHFMYTDNGIKDCSACDFPHRNGNYMRIIERFPDLAKLAAKKKDIET
ncbi:MAG: metal-binding protein [Clostridiales bacterium]|nr:metal-binding protein [Clostridiales bacterium]